LNPPSTPPIGAYIDDLSCLVPPEDSLFASDCFDELGAPQGIHLNLSKSMILSRLDPTKPMHHTVLEQALSKLKPSNHLQNGVVYFGTHPDNLNYIETALSNVAKQFDIQGKAIQGKLTRGFADKDNFMLKMLPPINPPPTSDQCLASFPFST
jgi:hypothetical protein